MCSDSSRPKATVSNTNLVFLSLHDVKDHKGPNEYQTVSHAPQNLVARTWSQPPVGRCPSPKGDNPMPVAERRQSKDSDEIHQMARSGIWWVEEDLNLRPHAYQACALTS